MRLRHETFFTWSVEDSGLRAMSYSNSNNDICQSKNVQAFFDGEIDPSKGLQFEQHLSECAACNQELRAIQTLQVLVSLALGSGSQISIASVCARQKDRQLDERNDFRRTGDKGRRLRW